MARTIIPDYTERGPRADLLNTDEAGKAMLTLIIQDLQQYFASTKGDEDKAGDIDDANYYEGCAWGVETALRMLTGVQLEIDDDGETVERSPS